MTDKVIVITDGSGMVYRIAEGDGCNLLEEDEEEGYVDYIMVSQYLSYEDYVNDNELDGAQVMLRTLYQDMFFSKEEVVDYLYERDFVYRRDYKFIDEIH